jgi:YfiH family protein
VIELLRWEVPGPYRVVFSTRVGGVSVGPYASLNLGLLTDDDPDRVAENRRLVANAAEVDAAAVAMNRQVHGTLVNRARPGARGEPGDGLWTDEPGVPMLALAADCLPVALVRRNGAGAAAAVLHVGRLGLLGGVLEAGIARLGGPVAAAVGPGIGACCYEVGEEVAAPYRERFGSSILRGRHLDLRQAAERVLRDAGCDAVEQFDLCTACDPDRFFSHRRDGGVTGRQGVIVCIA